MIRLLGVVLLCFSGFSSAANLPQWSAPEQRHHPRLGQALETASATWLAPEELVQRLASEPYVLLGEKHDNPDHHALQLWLLEQLHAQRKQATLLLEMLVPAQQAKIDAGRDESKLPSDILQQRLDWDPGWPWALYGDVVRWGLREPGQLKAANLDSEEIGRLYRSATPLMPEYDSATRAFLERTLIEAHCGKLSAEQVPSMLAIQHARDRRMAEALAAAPTPALLIAGSFHVRRDVGLPLHWQGEEEPVVVMLVEAGSELPSTKLADYVWLTPATAVTDYCEDW